VVSVFGWFCLVSLIYLVLASPVLVILVWLVVYVFYSIPVVNCNKNLTNGPITTIPPINAVPTTTNISYLLNDTNLTISTTTFSETSLSTIVVSTTQTKPSAIQHSSKRSQIGVIWGSIVGVIVLLILCVCGERLYSSGRKIYRKRIQGYEAKYGDADTDNMYGADDSEEEDDLMEHSP